MQVIDSNFLINVCNNSSITRINYKYFKKLSKTRSRVKKLFSIEKAKAKQAYKMKGTLQ